MNTKRPDHWPLFAVHFRVLLCGYMNKANPTYPIQAPTVFKIMSSTSNEPTRVINCIISTANKSKTTIPVNGKNLRHLRNNQGIHIPSGTNKTMFPNRFFTQASVEYLFFSKIRGLIVSNGTRLYWYFTPGVLSLTKSKLPIINTYNHAIHATIVSIHLVWSHERSFIFSYPPTFFL